MKHWRCAPLIVCLAATLPALGQDLMKQGAEAYNGGRYGEAASYFKQAVSAQPQSKLAWLHLANAQVKTFLRPPRGSDPRALAAEARTTLQTILAKDPNDVVSLWNLSLVETTAEDFDEAMRAVEKLIAIQPANKKAYYHAAVTQWARAYPPVMRAKKAGGAMDELRVKYSPILASGHSHIQSALTLDPEYWDAMAYDNLLFRLDAALAASPAEAAVLLRKADDRLGAVVAARVTPKPPTPVSADVAPPPIDPLLPPPPPPPPPPPAPAPPPPVRL
jgi:tetratricopeptide (TPR) repeat protein